MSPQKVGRLLKMRKIVKEIKRPRKALTIDQKMQVINRIEKGERMKHISLSLGLAPSTVHSIFGNRDKIRKSYESNIGGGNMHRVTKSRHEVFEKLEKYLVQWMENQTDRDVCLSTLQIQQKAISIFEDLKKKAVEEGDTMANELSFKASHGWFERFKTRAMLHKVVTGGTVFPNHLQKIIDEGGYTAKQIFNIDEIGLFWKRMPSCTFIAQDEKRVPGHKASKDRLTLLLGGNCAGDVKVKPLLVYHSENPCALKGMVKSSLPVMWRSNRKTWVTQEMFADYVQTYLSPFIEKYTAENDLENKALLIIDNAPGHPSSIVDYGDNIQVVFLPPNTMSLLQPMDQGVIETFKAYYLQLVMQYLVDGSDVNEQATLKQLWNDFTIKKALELIDCAWQKVSRITMNSVWQKLCPQFVEDFKGTEEVVDAKAKILVLANEAGFLEVDAKDVEDLLLSHGEELTTDELIQLDKHRLLEEEEAEKEGARETLDTTNLREVMDLADKMTKIICECDHDMTRSIAFKNAMTSALAPFKELYKRKLRESEQSSILSFFHPEESCNSLKDMSQPSTSGSSSEVIVFKRIRLSSSSSEPDIKCPPDSPLSPEYPLPFQE